MRDQEGGRLRLPGDVGEQVHDLAGQAGVEGGGRLVGEQDGGRAHEGAGDVDALALPTGELVHPAVSEPGESDAFQQLIGPVAARLPPPDVVGDKQLLPGGEGAQQVCLLEDEAAGAVDTHLPGGGFLQAGGHGQQRGFTGTGFPDQRGELPGVQGEGDVVDGGDLSGSVGVGEGDVVKVESHYPCPPRAMSGSTRATRRVAR